jgi:oligopeptide/dipeptide ABC transporter ATP-binding protein
LPPEFTLSVRNLTTRIRRGREVATVVNRLSFDIPAGRTLALVGESGCGKSMTALSIMRILPEPAALPPEGEVLYQGKNLLTLSEREMRKIRGRRIAMIFQDPMSALNPVYSIGNQLAEVAQLHLGLEGAAALDLALSALEEVGIPEAGRRLREYPHQLSGGMKQRVMIAMALMCQPDLLIADEPTTALDVTIQKQVLELMRELQRKRGMSILLITHDMGVVAEVADEVMVMYATESVEWGRTEDLLHRAAHPYTQGLLSSLPQNGVPGERLRAIPGYVPSLADLPSGCRFHPRCAQKMEQCCVNPVDSFKVAGEEHWARCWLYEGKDEGS